MTINSWILLYLSITLIRRVKLNSSQSQSSGRMLNNHNVGQRIANIHFSYSAKWVWTERYFVNFFIPEVRFSGVWASITIVHIRKFDSQFIQATKFSLSSFPIMLSILMQLKYHCQNYALSVVNENHQKTGLRKKHFIYWPTIDKGHQILLSAYRWHHLNL